jgi:hypothetical protein
MARTVRETFRQYLPGAGKDVLGNPKQGKTRVVGDINVTAYAGGDGEILTSTDIGMTTIDSMTMRVGDEASGAMSGETAHTRHVVYAKSTGHFYLYTVDDAGQKTGGADNSTERVEYVAEGDSAYDVELH